MANVEIQMIGYAFPGQRGACYSADLLLRQYKRVRGKKKKKFTYQEMKTVYTIVFFEKSTPEFQALKEEYIHRAKQVFNTGLTLNMLQEYISKELQEIDRNTVQYMIEEQQERIDAMEKENEELERRNKMQQEQLEAMESEIIELRKMVEKLSGMQKQNVFNETGIIKSAFK